MSNTRPHTQSNDTATIAEAFERAIFAAFEFEGSTSPNPPVGCVLLDKDGEVLACEAHHKAGQGHAEARAIEASRTSGTMERIHTAVVTLEPCNHTGRTPPCVQALVTTPVQVIWIACRDPNPHVAGGGAEALARTGCNVHFLANLDHPKRDELLQRSERLIAPFVKKKKTGIPYITVKQALDSNGSMIPPAGHKTFTSQTSLTLAHRLRRRADAILTGSGTILADLPEFTVRHVPDFDHKKRFLGILDRRRRVSSTYISDANNRGFNVIRGTDLRGIVSDLGTHGAMEILVEAGPTLTKSILDAGLWDEHIVIQKTTKPGDNDQVSIKTKKEADAGSNELCFQE